jgi:Uma2 family endonuclease
MMATSVETRRGIPVPEQRIVLWGVDWEVYETMLKLVGDRPIRLTYDRGDLELMSPSHDQERYKRLLGRWIETLTLELGLPCDAAGSTTWRKPLEDRGLEPDEGYYLANAERVVGRRIDLSVDPPPDLAIEVEISRSALNRMGIYAALGVPEVWRFDGEALRVEQLQADGTYREVAASPGLPFLPTEEVVRWLRLAETMGQTPWLRQFREWVRAELAPRFGGG